MSRFLIKLRQFLPWGALAVASIGLGAFLAVGASRVLRPDALAPNVESVNFGPALTFSPDVIDFGEAFDGTKLRKQIRVTNTSSQPINILNFVTPCGCTALLEQLPLGVGPGESRDLSFEMNTSKRLGQIETSLAIQVEEPDAKRAYKIDIRAVSHPSLTVSHEALDLGMIGPEEVRSASVVLTLLKSVENPDPIRLVRVPKGLSATMKEKTAPEGGGRQWQIDCSLTGREVLDEPFDADLVLTTPSTIKPELRIPVRARLHTAVTVEPATVNFAVIQGSELVSKSIKLTAEKGRRFRIVSAKAIDKSQSITTQVETGQDGLRETVGLRLTLDPGRCPKGFFQFKVGASYRLDSGKEETIMVAVRGYCP